MTTEGRLLGSHISDLVATRDTSVRPCDTALMQTVSSKVFMNLLQRRTHQLLPLAPIHNPAMKPNSRQHNGPAPSSTDHKRCQHRGLESLDSSPLTLLTPIRDAIGPGVENSGRQRTFLSPTTAPTTATPADRLCQSNIPRGQRCTCRIGCHVENSVTLLQESAQTSWLITAPPSN